MFTFLCFTLEIKRFQFKFKFSQLVGCVFTGGWAAFSSSSGSGGEGRAGRDVV